MPGYSRFACLTSAVEAGDVGTTAEAPLLIPTVGVDRLRFLRESTGTLIRRSRATFSRGEKGAGTIPLLRRKGRATLGARRSNSTLRAASFRRLVRVSKEFPPPGGVHANMIMNVGTAFRASFPWQPVRATGKFWDTFLRRRS